MKVLILSCSTGEGHNSAAKAYMEYLKSKGIEAVVTDTMSLVSTDAPKYASEIYLFSTKTKLFKFAYNAGSKVSESKSSKVKSPVYMANYLYCDKLEEYINSNGFDVVVCVHIFPAEALTALKRKGRLKAKSVFIMTDYTCIPFLQETELDFYIVPHRHLIEECVQKGLPREKLYPFGIPVRASFNRHGDKAAARESCIRIFADGNAGNLDPNDRWFLIMSGSMGFGNLQDCVTACLDKGGDSMQIILVCGNNSDLRDNLMETFEGRTNVHIIGFTDKVPMLMDACDVLFTKPGGLSSTEAAAKHIPIIHTEPIPGCETCNAQFFHYHNMSYATTDVNEQVEMAMLLSDGESEERKQMIRHQKEEINSHTCRDITTLLQ